MYSKLSLRNLLIVILILLIILANTRHHALLLDHSPRMHGHDIQPQRYQNDRHDARNPLDCRAKQLLADLDQGDCETDVWEDGGVPYALEGHLLDCPESRDERYAEEPEGEGPEESVQCLISKCFLLPCCLPSKTYMAISKASCFIISGIPEFAAKTP